MLMGTNTVSSTSNNSKLASVLGTTSTSTQTSAEKAQDRFLTLLVAQLNNQDPMNPMDNAQMTSQMAQINTVSGIQQLNDTVKSLTTQFSSMQMVQSATMVGREVLSSGNTVTINSGVGKGAVDLSSAADKVSVQILTPGGQLLGTVDMGAQAAGQHAFQWDASTYSGTSAPVFKVTATQGGKAVTTTTLTRDTVQSVGTDSTGALNLTLNSGKSVTYDAIKAVL